MMDSVYETESTVTAVTSDWIHYTLYDGNHRSLYFYMNATKSTEIIWCHYSLDILLTFSAV